MDKEYLIALIKFRKKQSIKIGNRINKLRKDKKISKKQMSSEAGISARTLTRIEAGTTFASFLVLKSITEILDVPLEEITGNDVFDGETDE